METRSGKRKKLLESENESSTGEDRLTDLPDSIIHHILLLIPIKSIAQTCVLSKRWRHIWYTFPDLDFTTVNNSQDFINNVLSFRYKHLFCSDIRILRLGATFTFSQLHCLMRSAVRHNIQQLDMEVVTEDCFNLPRSILSCESLKILKVKSISPGFRLPPWSILKDGFQSLHTLCLSHVILYQQPELVLDSSSFPLLNELNMDECIGLKHLSVYCRGLMKFTLDKCFQLDNLDIGCSKVETIIVSRCFDSSSSWVKIDAPKLEKIKWNENAVTDQSLVDNLSSLNEASVGFEGVTAAKLPSFCDFLTGLSQSRCLTLERPCVEILLKDKQFAGVILEPFVNLKSLELHTTNIQGLASLFRTHLALHKLVIKITNKYKLQKRQWYRDLSSSFDEEQYWESQIQAFKPFLQKLKIVTIHEISECEDEISLVKFLLGHAQVLQEMAISCRRQQSKFKGRCLRLERIKSKVMRFSRASSDAKLVFY